MSLQDMGVEKFQAVEIELDRAPGLGLQQIVKIVEQLV
jgi:hypothetical protein